MEALYQLSYSPLRTANITGDPADRKIAVPPVTHVPFGTRCHRFGASSANRRVGRVAYHQENG